MTKSFRTIDFLRKNERRDRPRFLARSMNYSFIVHFHYAMSLFPATRVTNAAARSWKYVIACSPFPVHLHNFSYLYPYLRVHFARIMHVRVRLGS